MENWCAAGKAYTKWTAQNMHVGINTGVPWVMCKQDDAPYSVLGPITVLVLFSLHMTTEIMMLKTKSDIWKQLHITCHLGSLAFSRTAKLQLTTLHGGFSSSSSSSSSYLRVLCSKFMWVGNERWCC